MPLFVLLCGGLSDLALAFKPTYHEQVTEQVLRSQGFDADSADEAGDSDYWTDYFEPNTDAAHGDNNMLAAASGRMRQKRTAIGDALNACKRRDALDALGEALHTVQDIYSHSNSVDNFILIPDILNMANGSAPCAPPAFAPTGLVSGYFNLGGFFTGNQCRGIPANMCCHRDLNKDEPGAPNGARHAPALDAARTATGNYLQLVEQDIRARFGEPNATQLIKLLKKKQRTTFFVIDDTGSMGDDIAGVQSAVNGFLDQIIAGNESPTLGLVTFKDNVTDRGPTCDIASLRGQVNALFADGGDDCPEASNSALLSALVHFPVLSTDVQLRGGRILLATDASAGDAFLGPQVAQQAALRGVSIDSILTGDCTSETLAAARTADAFVPSENSPARTATAAPQAAALTIDPLVSPSARTQLRALTEETGGVLFQVSRVEVDDVVPTLLELGEPDSAILVSRKVQLQAGVPRTFEIPVDDTLRDKVTFMVTASRSGALPAFSLQRPGGGTVAVGDADVAHRVLTSVETWSLSAPATGRWKVTLDGDGAFVLRAFGRTPFRIDGLRLQAPAPGTLRPEADLAPVAGQPLTGSDLVADLRFTDAPQSLAVALRALDGGSLASLSPQGLDERTFRSDLHVPASVFVVEATGLTPGGSEFVRQTSVPVAPQTIAVTAPGVVVAPAGSVATIVAEVRNLAGSAATFTLQTSSTLPWTISGPSTVTVGAGGTAQVTFTVNVPDRALEGDHNDLTIFAEDVTSPRVRNSAAVSVVVGGGDDRPPVCADATANPSTLWPPDHGMAPVEIRGVTDPDGDPVTVTVTGVTQDEAVDEPGSGNTSPDADGVGTATARVRAERSGKGDGRVYTLQFKASDGRGGACVGAVRVGVPHDQNGTAVDSGQRYDSTGTH